VFVVKLDVIFLVVYVIDGILFICVLCSCGSIILVIGGVGGYIMLDFKKSFGD